MGEMDRLSTCAHDNHGKMAGPCLSAIAVIGPRNWFLEAAGLPRAE